MSEKYRHRKNSYRRYSRRNVPEPQSKLANQLSAAIIFCIFIFAVSLINTESTQKVRLYTASLISRSIPDEVQFTDSMTDNIKMLVKTGLSSFYEVHKTLLFSANFGCFFPVILLPISTP